MNWFKANVRTGCPLQDLADASVLLAVPAPSALSGAAPSSGMLFISSTFVLSLSYSGGGSLGAHGASIGLAPGRAAFPAWYWHQGPACSQERVSLRVFFVAGLSCVQSELVFIINRIILAGKIELFFLFLSPLFPSRPECLWPRTAELQDAGVAPGTSRDQPCSKCLGGTSLGARLRPSLQDNAVIKLGLKLLPIASQSLTCSCLHLAGDSQ